MPARLTAVLLAALLIAPALPAQPAGEKKDDAPLGLKNLRHADPAVRYRTAELLAKQGPAAKFAAAELREALKDADGRVRIKAAEALWKIERTRPTLLLPVLTQALKDKDARVRAAAPAVLGLMGDKAKSAVPALVGALADKDLGVRLEVVIALGDIGPAARTAGPALLKLVDGDEGDPLLEPTVGAALAGLGAELLPDLAEALSHKSSARRRVAAYALGRIGKEGVAPLLAALQDRDASVRVLACTGLGLHGKDAARALAKVRELVDDPSPAVRIQAVRALWQIGGESKHVPALVRLLEADVGSRVDACQTLALLGPAARDAVPALTRALQDDDSLVRQCAAEALGRIGPPAEKAVPDLQARLKDEDKNVRLDAAFALWHITGQAKVAIDTLGPLLDDEALLQRRAAGRLGEMGEAARELLGTLAERYRELDEGPLRTAYADAIRRIDGKAAVSLGIK